MTTLLGIIFQVWVMLDCMHQLRLGFLGPRSFSLMLSLFCTCVTWRLASSVALYLFIGMLRYRSSKLLISLNQLGQSPVEAGISPQTWTLRIFRDWPQ